MVPLLQEAIADIMAGTSSIDEEPPATGVQVEARALRTGDGSGRASARGSAARIASVVVLDAMMIDQVWSQALRIA